MTLKVDWAAAPPKSTGTFITLFKFRNYVEVVVKVVPISQDPILLDVLR